MTRAELRELARFYVNDLGTARIKDTSTTEYDLNQALFAALERYYRKTRCSLVNYTLAGTVGKAIYSYGAFGQEAADLDSVSVSAAANTTTAFALIQRLDFSGTVTGGTFTLSITATDGTIYPSAALAWNISNANLKTAVDALLVTAGYATASVTVTGGASPVDTVLSFAGGSPVMTADDALLTGGGTMSVVREPSATINPSHYVTVTIKNNTGAPGTGTLSLVTIAGTLASGAACTEVLTFTAAELVLADGAVKTHTTLNPYASLTSITPSAAQPSATWLHYAGVAVEAPGNRIWDLTYVAYNEIALDNHDRDWMDKWSAKWRFSGNGTPSVWIGWGDKQFRLWHPLSGTDDIYIEGWQTPDARVLADDTQTPPVEATEQEILAMDAAILVTIRDSKDEQLVRQSALWAQRDDGWAKAYQRIHGTGDRSIIFGRGKDVLTSDMPPYSNGITNI